MFEIIATELRNEFTLTSQLHISLIVMTLGNDESNFQPQVKRRRGGGQRYRFEAIALA